MARLKTSILLPLPHTMGATAFVLVAAACVAGVLGDAKPDTSTSSSSEEDIQGSHSVPSPHFIPYGVVTPLAPTAHLTPSIRPAIYNGGRSTAHVQVLHPGAKALGIKKVVVTRPPLSHKNSGNLFLGFGAPSFTPAPARHRPAGHDHKQSGSCPRYTRCVPLVMCSPCFEEIEPNSYSLTCPLYSGAAGVCCPDLGGPGTTSRVLPPPRPNAPLRRLSFSSDMVNEAARSSLWQLEERDKLEYFLMSNGITVTQPGTAEYSHLQFFRTSPLAMKISRDALTHTGAGDYLLTRLRLSPAEASFGLQQVSLKDSIIENTCPRRPNCGKKENFYRTIDGSCNNLQNPRNGQARTPFTRITPPRYSDGLWRPRISVTGQQLPSARLVSTTIARDVDLPNNDLTLFVMQWGQFIDHDLTHTPIFRFSNDTGILCCDGARPVHPSCFPIIIPEDDYFHAPRTRRRCMNFVRSMPAPRSCNLGYTEQMNQITHHLDGSNIYGSSRSEEQELREHSGGLLRVNNGLLPADLSTMMCTVSDLPCFMAGDNRVNEQAQLAVMHTLWARFHNVIARELSRLNPHWNDETLFQEARRIVVAIYQHIIYNEWLPLILGKECMARNGLLPLRHGYSNMYDPSLSPIVTNEFATAAFRFGHTLVQGMVDLFGRDGSHTDRLDLVDQFNNPSLIYTPGKLDEFLRGLATQPPQQLDNFVSSALTNRLFEREQAFGFDLVALNTQRGRDHAIGTYNDIREVCGLPRARTFEDFLDVLPSEVVAGFARIYASPEDVDPFIAGISERHVPGAMVGPIFKCIITDQFARLRQSDRFFYDLGGMPTSFTEAQLQQIRRTSFARVLCLAGENLRGIQPLALRAPRGINERVACDNPAIPHLDLTAWTSTTGSNHY
ncbi:peroxidase-like isoform X2 [Eriocheir sinensis]|uniref:peroxidase-like isoform X2 n=1 Tax=Eriocheir sinensis TaxID=95602 RepID=UPI0021C68275|nr:peroxidase-like isoform X2 [Eriocheir sinensis]